MYLGLTQKIDVNEFGTLPRKILLTSGSQVFNITALISVKDFATNR